MSQDAPPRGRCRLRVWPSIVAGSGSHPGAARYVRDPIDHEFCNFLPDGLCIAVHRPDPGSMPSSPGSGLVNRSATFPRPGRRHPVGLARNLFDMGFSLVELPEGVA